MAAMLVKNREHHKFTLDNFEGPLSFLLYLVQKSEINISEVSLQEIISQYFDRLIQIPDPDVDEGAEFISTTASLLWLKSKMLLPAHEQGGSLELEQEDSPFTILPQLIEYLQFKQAAKDFGEREQRQMGYYVRGHEFSNDSCKKMLGIEHISLGDLVSFFETALQKANQERGIIHEEVWRVSDKILDIRKSLKAGKQLDLRVLFSPEKCRDELIVTFLAILELMKLGEIAVVKETSEGILSIIPKHNQEDSNG